MNFTRAIVLAIVLRMSGGSLFAAVTANSADGIFQLRKQTPELRGKVSALQPLFNSQPFIADIERIKSTLLSVPPPNATFAPRAFLRPIELSLPTPDGGKFLRFALEEVPIMHPDLAAKYPQIKTYRGRGVDDRGATLAFDVTPAGMHALIRTGNGAIYIDPVYRGNDRIYVSYYKRDVVREARRRPFICDTPGETRGRFDRLSGTQPLTTSGTQLRTYRLACAANSTYTAYQGDTVPAGLAAVVVVINRVSAVYEAELAIRLQLIANNDEIIYPTTGNPVNGADPYSNDESALDENQTNLDSVIGANNYDIGHVFTTGSGGIAGLGVVCGSGEKAEGTTGLDDPIGDAFNVDYVAHEMGHQFGANHTFNATTSNCAGNRASQHAYEPGSGTTIMAYAGICGMASDLAPHSDAYFSFESLREIVAYTTTGTGGSCPVTTNTGNNVPTLSAGSNFTIPSRTPFALTGSGSDANGDTLTYCWEERDLGAAQAGNVADNGTSPIFRSFNPTYTPTRTFPKMANLVAGIFTNTVAPHGETLPITNRTLNFRLTVRDNRANGGAINTADMAVSVVENGTGFSVTAPGTSGPFTNGSNLNVTWNVTGTNVAPVNAASVKISLSTDGGYTYPYTLAASTPNDGSQTVALPVGVTTASGRIKVEAIGNIFFSISPVNFTVN
jgi:hypothetical protein